MFQIDKKAKLTADIIRDAIAYNEERRARFNKLEEYYLGKQAIFSRTKKDANPINNKVMINNAKYITDIYVGYLLGNPVEYQAKDGINIQPVLDAYKRQTIDTMDVEIAEDCSIMGMKYEYVFSNENSEPCSVALDDRNTIIIYDNSITHEKLYGINYRPIFKGADNEIPDHYEVLVVSDKEIMTYEVPHTKGNYKEIATRQNHAFGAVPIIEYRNNPQLMGDFEPVISIIDAYNLIQSDRVNDREQLVDAILCFYGMDFDEEQMSALKEKRALAKIPVDGKVEYLVKNINEGDADVLRKTLEQDIHKISMAPNMSDQNFVGNASGVAIRYKILAFEQKVKNKERLFEKSLMERFKLYSNFLNTKSMMEAIDISDVDAIFKRNLPSNDYEISQMINNLDGIIDRELLAAQLSFVKDASDTIETAERDEQEQLKDADYNANDYTDNNEDNTETEQ